MAHIYLDIRMGLGKLFQSFRCGNDAHELDVPAAMLFDEIHCFRTGAAGGEHGVKDHDGPLVDGLREFAVIFVGGMGFGVAV